MNPLSNPRLPPGTYRDLGGVWLFEGKITRDAAGAFEDASNLLNHCTNPGSQLLQKLREDILLSPEGPLWERPELMQALGKPAASLSMSGGHLALWIMIEDSSEIVFLLWSDAHRKKTRRGSSIEVLPGPAGPVDADALERAYDRLRACARTVVTGKDGDAAAADLRAPDAATDDGAAPLRAQRHRG